jgi:hypothetical protein
MRMVQRLTTAAEHPQLHREYARQEVPANKSRLYQNNILGRTLTSVSSFPYAPLRLLFFGLGDLCSMVQILSQLCLASECADRSDNA